MAEGELAAAFENEACVDVSVVETPITELAYDGAVSGMKSLSVLANHELRSIAVEPELLQVQIGSNARLHRVDVRAQWVTVSGDLSSLHEIAYANVSERNEPIDGRGLSLQEAPEVRALRMECEGSCPSHVFYWINGPLAPLEEISFELVGEPLSDLALSPPYAFGSIEPLRRLGVPRERISISTPQRADVMAAYDEWLRESGFPGTLEVCIEDQPNEACE